MSAKNHQLFSTLFSSRGCVTLRRLEIFDCQMVSRNGIHRLEVHTHISIPIPQQLQSYSTTPLPFHTQLQSRSTISFPHSHSTLDFIPPFQFHTWLHSPIPIPPEVETGYEGTRLLPAPNSTPCCIPASQNHLQMLHVTIATAIMLRFFTHHFFTAVSSVI